MPSNSEGFTFDALTQLKDAGLVAASAAATVAAAAKVLDLGPGRIDGRIILDFSAIEVDTGNEKYDILAQVSNSLTFAATNFVAGQVTVGHSSVNNESASTAAPRRQELMFTNEINGVLYRYLRLFTVVAGTIATGINYTGFLVQDW